MVVRAQLMIHRVLYVSGHIILNALEYPGEAHVIADRVVNNVNRLALLGSQTKKIVLSKE